MAMNHRRAARAARRTLSRRSPQLRSGPTDCCISGRGLRPRAHDGAGAACYSAPFRSQPEGAAVPDLKSLIRTIPDYPKKGIMFRDVTTLLGDAQGFKATVERMAAPFAGARVQAVAGIEARGFILGGAIADRLQCGF